MQKTFKGMGDCITPKAIFSECRTWRYTLSRTWTDQTPACNVLFILLNPSTADENEDDPTLRRGINFAKRWGFGGIVFCNLFAFCTAHPRELKRAQYPVGPINDWHIIEQVDKAEQIILAWGAHGHYRFRDDAVLKILKGRKLWCLGTTKGGFPMHPLYLPNNVKREIFK